MFRPLDFLLESVLNRGVSPQHSYDRNPYSLAPQPAQPTTDAIRADAWAPPYSGPGDLDDYGRETETMRTAYREFFRKEPTVRSALEGLIASIADSDVSVMPEDDSRDVDCKAAEFVQWTVERSPHGWDGLIRGVGISGLIDGWSVSEITLGGTSAHNKWGGFWGLRHVKNRDTAHLRLQLDVYRNVVGVVNTVRGIATYPVRKAIVFRHADIYDNPFGTSEMRAIYRDCQLIENAYKLWSYALKATAGPFLKGKYNRAENRKAMERALAEARAGGFITMSKDEEVEVLNLATATSFAAFERQIDKLREEVYMSIRGAYLPYMQGSGGGGDQHGDTGISKSAGANPRERVLAKSIARCLTLQLIPSLVVPNFGENCGLPRIVLGGVDWAETKTQLDVAKSLLNDFKLPISKKHLYTISQTPPPMGDDDAVAPSEPPQPPPPPPGGGFNFSQTFDSTGKPPHPNLVPKSGDPMHPVAWVLPQETDAAVAKAKGGAQPAAPAPGAAHQAGAAARKAVDAVKGIVSAAKATALGRLAMKAEHVGFYAMKKAQEIGQVAAEKRGYTPEQTAKLKHRLYMADLVGGYATGAAGAAIGGIIGAKIGMVTPSASAVYLAYSTAINPAATWSAARQVIAATLAGKGGHHSAKFSDAAFHDRLADYFEKHDAQPDWAEAVFLRATAEGHDDPIAVAEEAMEKQPEPPGELPTPTEEDFGLGNDPEGGAGFFPATFCGGR